LPSQPEKRRQRSANIHHDGDVEEVIEIIDDDEDEVIVSD
jgi:hypothetical protein